MSVREAELEEAVNALRNVLGRIVERRVDLDGKPYEFLGAERAEALALAGAVMSRR